MNCAPRREATGTRPGGTRGRGRTADLSPAWALLALIARAVPLSIAGLLPVVPAVAAEERVMVGGLLDAEFWATDDGSRLLSRNEGEPAHAGRLRLWAAVEILPGLQGFTLGEVEGGPATGEEETEVELEQAFLRYTLNIRSHLRIEAGRVVAPLGNFSRRYFSNVNPLIGSPDSYSVSYPFGIQVIGRAAAFDYSVSILDRPLVNENYVPELESSALRPAVTLGLTPVVGLRLGVYGTRGPYLGEAITPFLPAGPAWDDYEQSIGGFDLQFSRGHFELNGDLARSSYDAPGLTRSLRGTAWFVEPKFTFSPRWFGALRYEVNDYPYIQPISPGVWIATAAKLSDIEAGVGYRITPDAILKLAYRADRWDVAASQKAFFPDGYSIAAQLSWTFDLLSWFDRPK